MQITCTKFPKCEKNCKKNNNNKIKFRLYDLRKHHTLSNKNLKIIQYTKMNFSIAKINRVVEFFSQRITNTHNSQLGFKRNTTSKPKRSVVDIFVPAFVLVIRFVKES